MTKEQLPDPEDDKFFRDIQDLLNRNNPAVPGAEPIEPAPQEITSPRRQARDFIFKWDKSRQHLSPKEQRLSENSPRYQQTFGYFRDYLIFLVGFIPEVQAALLAAQRDFLETDADTSEESWAKLNTLNQRGFVEFDPDQVAHILDRGIQAQFQLRNERYHSLSLVADDLVLEWSRQPFGDEELVAEITQEALDTSPHREGISLVLDTGQTDYSALLGLPPGLDLTERNASTIFYYERLTINQPKPSKTERIKPKIDKFDVQIADEKLNEIRNNRSFH